MAALSVLEAHGAVGAAGRLERRSSAAAPWGLPPVVLRPGWLPWVLRPLLQPLSRSPALLWCVVACFEPVRSQCASSATAAAAPRASYACHTPATLTHAVRTVRAPADVDAGAMQTTVGSHWRRQVRVACVAFSADAAARRERSRRRTAAPCGAVAAPIRAPWSLRVMSRLAQSLLTA